MFTHFPVWGELGEAEGDGGEGDEGAVEHGEHGQHLPERHLVALNHLGHFCLSLPLSKLCTEDLMKKMPIPCTKIVQ